MFNVALFSAQGETRVKTRGNITDVTGSLILN